jgi:homoserine acetyltransferase
MSSRKIWLLVGSSVMVICLIVLGGCRRSSEVSRAAPETAAPWTLSMVAPIEHLDVAAREPMIIEHPDGTLFVSG